MVDVAVVDVGLVGDAEVFDDVGLVAIDVVCIALSR